MANAQKNDLKPWLKQQWVIPPQANAAFVANMEDVLEVYHRPYDATRPVVCLDEGGKQLIGDVRPPLATRPGRIAKEDSEYVRGGTANVFMAFEPLAGVRTVSVTERRGAIDLARFVWHVVMEVYAQAQRVILVTDNLSTHSAASFYRAFEPEKARTLAERIEWHFTPVHGSWLNMAEIEH